MDDRGMSYLDTRNNVAHCGHCHPRIVAAVSAQVALLNTNSRYLHPVVCELAGRLVATLPGDSLDTVFFCNSGSEANDLALRLARAWSNGCTNTIVVDGAYHGHTLATLEVSPYKYESSKEYSVPQQQQSPTTTSDGCSNSAAMRAPTGTSSPGRHIWKVPCPDVWRGPYCNLATAGALYAAHVKDACQFYSTDTTPPPRCRSEVPSSPGGDHDATKRGGAGVRAFIVEGGMSVAGVILPPPGYLRASVDAVHQAGGLYIADEVQTGFGRLGSCFWAFQYRHDYDNDDNDDDSSTDDVVVPDIVTVGKPFGNGMPLAAVVTSRKVAAAFEACHVEYFNTFGGNPVSAAAGLAVLDVIRDENLQQNALEVGTYLKTKFRKLQETIEWIGDVRGSGLFLGVELVECRATRAPATAVTSWLCSQLKETYHVLTSIDGPHNNVIVIKPPMVFSIEDADYFVDCVRRALTEDLRDAAGTLADLGKTPT